MNEPDAAENCKEIKNNIEQYTYVYIIDYTHYL